MKDLEKEKQELDDLIKKTIGLKIRQVTSSNNNNNNNNTRILQEPQKVTSLTSKESNGLRCEICNEVFKEKHHMR